MSATGPTVRVPEATRWDCHSCGACCRLYELGPVEPEIIAQLTERGIERHWAPAAAGPWYQVRHAPEGEEYYFLTHRDGHCVFLRDDNRCAVHGLFGATAKPAFCREYPFHLVDDPKGTVAVIRTSCAGFHASSRDGTPLELQLDEVTALPRVFPRRRFQPAVVQVLPETAISLALWMEWESRLLDLLSGEAPEPEFAVVRLRAAIHEWAGRTAPTPDAKKARLAAGAAIEGLRRLMARVSGEARPDEDPHRVQFATDMASLLERALHGQRTPAPLAPDAQRYLLLLLRSFLLAKGFHVLGGLTEGLGAFLLQVAIVRGAAAAGPTGVDAQSASDVVVRWTKLVENRAVTGVLKLARPALVDLFLYADPGAQDVRA